MIHQKKRERHMSWPTMKRFNFGSQTVQTSLIRPIKREGLKGRILQISDRDVSQQGIVKHKDIVKSSLT